MHPSISQLQSKAGIVSSSPLQQTDCIAQHTDEEILSFADALNSRPRRVLGYHTPEDLFDTFLDKVYAC